MEINTHIRVFSQRSREINLRMTRQSKDLESIFSKLHSAMMGNHEEGFSEKAQTLAYEPVHVGEIEDADGQGHVKGRCGDSMTIYLSVKDNHVENATFLTDGCGATLACGSSVTELLRGKTRLQASRIQAQHVIRDLNGLPPSHTHCAVLAVQALKKALEAWHKNS